jgi:hypothetical protein
MQTDWLGKLEDFVSRKEIDFELKKIAEIENNVS